MKKYTMVLNDGTLLAHGEDRGNTVNLGIKKMKDLKVNVCILQTIVNKEMVYTDWIIL